MMKKVIKVSVLLDIPWLEIERGFWQFFISLYKIWTSSDSLLLGLIFCFQRVRKYQGSKNGHILYSNLIYKIILVFFIMLTHAGWHREVYWGFQANWTFSAGPVPRYFSDYMLHAAQLHPVCAAQLLTLHQHRVDSQFYRTVNQI